MRPIDESGNVHGNLAVLRSAGNAGRGMRWLCRCTCGRLCTTTGTNMRTGRARSCGCLKRTATVNANRARLTRARA